MASNRTERKLLLAVIDYGLEFLENTLKSYVNDLYPEKDSKSGYRQLGSFTAGGDE